MDFKVIQVNADQAEDQVNEDTTSALSAVLMDKDVERATVFVADLGLKINPSKLLVGAMQLRPELSLINMAFIGSECVDDNLVEVITSTMGIDETIIILGATKQDLLTVSSHVGFKGYKVWLISFEDILGEGVETVDFKLPEENTDPNMLLLQMNSTLYELLVRTSTLEEKLNRLLDSKPTN